MELVQVVSKCRFFVFVKNADFDIEQDLEHQHRDVKVLPCCVVEINKGKIPPLKSSSEPLVVSVCQKKIIKDCIFKLAPNPTSVT